MIIDLSPLWSRAEKCFQKVVLNSTLITNRYNAKGSWRTARQLPCGSCTLFPSKWKRYIKPIGNAT